MNYFPLFTVQIFISMDTLISARHKQHIYFSIFLYIVDIVNLQDIVAQLKHSVQVLNQLASTGIKCKERKIDALNTIEDISSKRPSSPTVSIVS